MRVKNQEISDAIAPKGDLSLVALHSSVSISSGRASEARHDRVSGGWDK